MSQKSVEQIVGKLATDEEFRSRFAADPPAILSALGQQGVDLTAWERAALEAIDVKKCEAFAAGIDPRLQKASLREECCGAWLRQFTEKRS